MYKYKKVQSMKSSNVFNLTNQVLFYTQYLLKTYFNTETKSTFTCPRNKVNITYYFMIRDAEDVKVRSFPASLY